MYKNQSSQTLSKTCNPNSILRSRSLGLLTYLCCVVSLRISWCIKQATFLLTQKMIPHISILKFWNTKNDYSYTNIEILEANYHLLYRRNKYINNGSYY
uniref:Uncharacterized protein n=1 Tax=Arundo donax TaxID=35708 RepID=A0A0A9FGN8_ARUDO